MFSEGGGTQMFNQAVKKMKVRYIGNSLCCDCGNGETKTLISGKVYDAYTSPVSLIRYIFVITEEGTRLGVPPKQLEIIQ